MLPLKPPSSQPYLTWRIGNLIVIGLMVGVCMASGFFIYQHIYRTLDDANSIVLLNSSIGFDNINLDTFKKAEAFIETKQSIPSVSSTVRNIFDFSSSTSHGTASSSPVTSSAH